MSGFSERRELDEFDQGPNGCFGVERGCFMCFELKRKEQEPKQTTPALVTGYLITAQITLR
jgi:hypothetical protein